MKKAIIYVRGHNQEMQEVKCRLYAAEKGYKVLFVTRHIEDINGCDILIVTTASRISRNSIEYHTILKELKSNGIEVESASGQVKDIEFEELLRDLLR